MIAIKSRQKRSKMKSSEYKNKTKRMEELLKLLTEKGSLNLKLQKELDKISDEIANYEEENYPFKVESLTEMIELRMYQRKLKQKDIAQILGTTPSRVSEILNGKRGLTIDLAKGLYNKLNIDPKFILSE
jgi:HTH-type transcriptional regulator/antitoxin HigA